LRKKAVTWAVREKGYSQRRACGLAGLHPKTYRYASKRSGDEELRVRLRELASQRRRFGYRRLGLMLKRQGIKLNRKKLYRLYKEERLSAQARWPQTGTGHAGADGDPAGSQSALVARLRGRHAGEWPTLPHPHPGR
jgi:HTH-like domain